LGQNLLYANSHLSLELPTAVQQAETQIRRYKGVLMHNAIRTITTTDAKANLEDVLASLSSSGPIEITTNGKPVGLLTLPSTPPLDQGRLSVLATAYSNGLLSWPQIAEETGASFGDLLLALGAKNLSLPKVVAKNRPEQTALLNKILDLALKSKEEK
jgi:antitoxin (DNA-binding transcriptional repressor) of toxin-antitoxin stability system